MDMSPAYVKGATEYFPRARIVFDKFHVRPEVSKHGSRMRDRENPLLIAVRGQLTNSLSNRKIYYGSGHVSQTRWRQRRV